MLVLVSMTSTAWLGRSAEYMICRFGSNDRRSKLALVFKGGGGVGFVVTTQFGIIICAINEIDDARADVKPNPRKSNARTNTKFILTVDFIDASLLAQNRASA